MIFEKILICAVILVYFLASLGIFIGTLSRRRTIKTASNWVTISGFVLNTLLVITTLITHTYDELTEAYYLQLLSWVIILLYLCAWCWLRLRFLALTAAPLALLLTFFSLRSSQSQILLPENLAGLFMGLHIWALFISWGLMALASGAGVLFLFVERKLKKKVPLTDFTWDLPSLSTFDKVNYMAVLVGFPCYTLGLMAGFIWSPLFSLAVSSPKTVLSLATWFFFALLFYQRLALGYRGRKTAILAIIIFCLSATSLMADQIFYHHSRILQIQ